MNVWWVSLFENIRARGYADQAIVEALLNGDAYGLSMPPLEHHEGLPTGPDGGVVVIPARWHIDAVDTIAAALDRMEWALVILTGDEESVFPWERLRGPTRRVWVQTPRPDVHAEADGLLGDGWWPGLREWARSNEQPRRVNWFYSGQINNPRREECYRALTARRERRRDGTAKATPGFAGGMMQGDYRDRLASARVAPAPSGSYSPDTFRLFEALELGCVPIVDRGVEGRAHPDYWRFVFHVEPPFPVLDDWALVDDAIDRIAADWPRAANDTLAWWVREKRASAHLMRDHLTTLSGWAPPERVDGRVTVLMPVSPIPSHPASEVIEETLRSVRERLPGAEIIVMFDGVRPEQESRAAAYAEHVRRMLRRINLGEFGPVVPLVFPHHHHQAAMTAEALQWVRTRSVLFVEQDTPLIGDIPFDGLLRAVESGRAHVVRLHHEASVLPPHEHLMLDQTAQMVEGEPMLRTVLWCQRPHVAAADFYRNMIGRYFGANARSFIEDVIHGVVDNLWQNRREAGWDEFRLWLYAPPGDIKRSTHLDGRAGDPKYAQTWAYPSPAVPPGAPNPRVAVPAAPRHGRRPSVKWGLIGRADRRGLAIQTTEIARHLDPDRVLGIDMGDLSPYRPDWSEYNPDTLTVMRLDDLTPHVARRWLEGLDTVVTAETFYRGWWTGLCAEMGVATILAPNPEFFSHVAAPDWAPLPDLLAAPTRWRIGDIPGAVYLPHPVDRQRLAYRHRTEARTFLHVIGHAAKWDRAGTRILWEALPHVKQPCRLVVRSQSGASVPGRFPNVTVEVIDRDVPDHADLYADGDVMILPRRYGGLCLPMQEALSCGMPVLMPDASPQASVLPAGMLLPCVTERSVPALGGAMAVHDTNARALAARIDDLVANPREMAGLSAAANEIADSLSWDRLAATWCAAIETVAAHRLVS